MRSGLCRSVGSYLAWSDTTSYFCLFYPRLREGYVHAKRCWDAVLFTLYPSNLRGSWHIARFQLNELMMNACVCASLFSSARFSSVAQSCPTLCDPMNRSTPGLPVHRQLPEFTQTHVHQVSDAIQPSHPLVIPFSSCPQSLPASESFPMSQLFPWCGQGIGVSA